MQDTLSEEHHLEQLIDLYCRGWSTSEAAERERLVRLALTSDATYCDPRTDGELDVTALLSHMERIRAARPGAQVVRTSNVDVHHSFVRFHWRVVLADGARLPICLDVVELSHDRRRLKRVIGFFTQMRSSGSFAGE